MGQAASALAEEEDVSMLQFSQTFEDWFYSSTYTVVSEE
jgi:hypothetical protein